MGAQRNATLTAHQFWIQQRMSTEFLTKFWMALWERKQDMKIVVFQWLLIHRALPVGHVGAGRRRKTARDELPKQD